MKLQKCYWLKQMQEHYHHQQHQKSSSASSQPVRVTNPSSITTSAVTGLSTTPSWQSSGARSSSVPAGTSSMSQYQHSVFPGPALSTGRHIATLSVDATGNGRTIPDVTCEPQLWIPADVNLSLALSMLLRSIPPSRLNKAGLSVHPYIRPQKVFQFEQNLVCRKRSVSDTRRYAIWPHPRSRSRQCESCENSQFQRLSSPPICMQSNDWWWIMILQDNI